MEFRPEVHRQDYLLQEFIRNGTMTLLFGLVVFLTTNAVLLVEGRAQWYLTGKNFNDERISTIYEKEIIDIWEFTENPSLKINDSHTSFGGALAIYRGHNTSLDPPLELLANDLFRSRYEKGCKVDVTDVWTYHTFVTVTQKDPLEYEIGLFDRAK